MIPGILRKNLRMWNSEIVNGFGNLVSRTLHLIDLKNIDTTRLPKNKKIGEKITNLYHDSLELIAVKYDFQKLRFWKILGNKYRFAWMVLFKMR